MGCVNTKSKEFKFLAEHHDVSINALEQMVHKYWLETGKEDSFPSSVYIQAQKGFGQYQETNKVTRDFWKKNYSSPKEYNTIEEVRAAKEEAAAYFPTDAISYYENNKGNYVMVVKEPVETRNLDVKSILGEYTLDPQGIADFLMIQASISGKPITLTEAQKIITPQLVQLLKDNEPKLGSKVHLLSGITEFFKNNSNAINSIQQAIEENQEMQDIKAKAIADGTFMKAPNSKDTNLTERQWLQVRTKNFINWFGDWINDPTNASKVVDENGEPLVVYHGTTFSNDIRIFDPQKSYFTESKVEADKYGDKFRHPQDNSPKSIPVFLNIRNPHIFDAEGREYSNINDGNFVTFDEFLESHPEYQNESWYWKYQVGEEGLNIPKNVMDAYHKVSTSKTVRTYVSENIGKNNDGVIVKNVLDPADGNISKTFPITDYVPNSSNQIKSATDNNGMFSTENDDIQMFMTTNGEIYGFVDKDGNIYLDETIISPEHPIHEYTHLWDRVIAEKKPELWKRGIELMKDPNLKLKGHDKTIWQEVEEDVNYGQKWQRLKESNPSKYESLIASEVHAKITGKKGLKMLDEIAEQKGAKGIVAKLKEWMLAVWKELKATFSNWSDEDLQKLTLQDFVQMTIRDFADGMDLTQTVNQSSEAKAIPGPEVQINIYAGTGENADLSNLAIRPFSLNRFAAIPTNKDWHTEATDSHKILDRVSKILERSNLVGSNDSNPIQVNSVENLFQALKVLYGADEYFETVENDDEFRLSKEGKQLFLVILRATPARAKQLGKTVKGLNSNVWDTDSSALMKAVIQVSFGSNPQALQKLLATGNATLTHNQDRGKWGTEFPRLLMEVRNELRNENPQGEVKAEVYSQVAVEDAISDLITEGYAREDIVVEHIPATENTDDYYQVKVKTSSETSDTVTPVETTPEKKMVEQNLSEFDKLITQFNNLLDSNVISASEIRHIAELVVNSISDTITLLQVEKDAPQKFFPTLNTDLDFQNATRKQIIETVGVDRLVRRAKLQFDPENNEYEDLTTLEQADLIVDNWDAIISLASDVFVMNEGVGISKNYDTGGFTTTESSDVSYDNFNSEARSIEEIEEMEGDEQEHWQIESRTIDVLNSMSTLVRLALHECYQVDRDGNKVMSKWGIAERVNPRKAVNSILRWTQGSLSLQDMITKLIAKSERNPWINQLVDRLSDTSGKETDFQSQFYGVFSKHFQNYSIVKLENGKYYSMPVNNHPVLTEAVQSITALYKMGELALFTQNGINQKLLGSEKTVSPESEFNLHKAWAELKGVQEQLRHEGTLSEEMAKTAVANLTAVSKVLGYPVTEEMMSEILDKESLQTMTSALGYIIRDLKAASHTLKTNAGKATDYNPFAFGGENSIEGDLKNFLTPLTDSLEDTAVNAFYDSGKMYQSYITPSFTTKLMTKFRLEGQAFEDFIMSEYGNSEWFRSPDKGGKKGHWKNVWLRKLATDKNTKKVFDHKVELNFNKHNYMRNMSDAEYTLSLITEYFAESGKKEQALTPAWFRIPMQSNKPSSEFIKFVSYRGSTYKEDIVSGMYDMFLQELARIQTVNMRNRTKNDADFIQNFDTNGKKFNFLPFLNEYLETSNKTPLAKLLQKKLAGNVELTAEEETQLSNLVNNAIFQHMEDRAQTILNEWERNGILETAKGVDGIAANEALKTDKGYIRGRLENFLWNDAFAAKNILQLTVIDIAFYKDAEDLQKRLAQLHAPGTRGNIHATDYEGNRVSDGMYRTIILQDFDKFKSNIIANITEVFDKRIAAAPESQKASLRALKENLVGENGKYTKINVTDAQAYSSPSSYRKKAFIFGRWSRKAEEIYQKLQKGEYTYTDLETAFQPLKPFVYTHLQKDLGVGNAPIHQMAVPFQAKNAEYLLIMADAILQGESLSRPNLLRAVYQVMEESEKLNPTRGIDTVQFESAIKSGNQGAMNINPFLTMEGGEQGAIAYMTNQIYKKNADGARSTEYDTDTFVQETSYEDYCLQQEVPEHFKDHFQAHGSQIRMITPSDLDLYKNPNGDLSDPSNQVWYEWTEPDGTQKKVKANEFRKEYEQTIADNIEESISLLEKELHFDSTDKKERNIALSKILQREILSSPRYGVDLIQACSVDKETGNFRIPKGDPIQAKRIEQLINSIIKNRVNKQKIAGGPIVQVSNFGASRQLHIRFNDKNGGILMTKEEYEGQETAPKKSYKEYIKENQAGIAYFEVFMPIWSKELFDKFSDSKGNINVEAIEATDPELLRMVSYRIPTEDKYSCAPMKVVGFMPREAGDAIMLPYELTEIDDSDFDVDKRYVMRKTLPIKTRSRNEIEQKLFEIASEDYKQKHDGKTNNRYVGDQVKMFMDNPERMKNADALMQWLYQQYQRIAYYTEPPVSGKLYRDNKIVDMTLAVLTNEVTADKILNPGGFDPLKRMGYMVTAYKKPGNTYPWNQLQKMSIDELNDACYTDKDLTWADVQVQFYKQNSAAASLIGVFAVNKVAHATLESNDILLDISEICGVDPFTIAGTTFGGRMYIDPKYDSTGNLIGKTLGMGVSASADAAKTPVLNLMNINMTTVGAYTTLLRLGMPVEDASLFMSQNIIERVLNEFNRENLTNYQPLSKIIEKHLDEFRKTFEVSEDDAINTEPLTREELIEGLTSGEHLETDYKVLLAFQKVRSLVDAMRNPTFATRFNSISSAVGPLIIDNLMTEHRVDQFLDSSNMDGTHFYSSDGMTVDIDDIFFDHPVLKQFAYTLEIARIMFQDMPAGSTGFRNLLASLPEGLSNKIYNDKKLLDDLSNFYQSYLLIASKMVNPDNLKRYIENFPKYFNDQQFKEKYENNALIQAIKTNFNKKTGRAFLTINITGIDEPQKEVYRNAWIDLHKENPELSKQLFEYCFFRTGVGFSPKTFMSLVPTYVKERLYTDLKDGRRVTYVDTYSVFPSVTPNLVIDQFVRNNWNNNKLVPKKGGKGTKYTIDLKKGTLVTQDPSDLKDLKDVDYIKTRDNGQTHLWKLTYADKEMTVYNLITPLGNNGEYMEMSLSDITKPVSQTTDSLEDLEDTGIRQESQAETEMAEASNVDLISETERTQEVLDFIDAIMRQNPRLNKAEAETMFEDMKKTPKLYAKFMVNVFSKMGLTLNQEEAMKEFNKLC